MGNGITKNPCFTGDPYAAAVASDPLPDDSQGHSFTYVPSGAAFDKPPTAATLSSEPSFFSLSGAAISANMATSASMPSFRLFNELTWPPSAANTFESSRSFAAVPLQAAPPRLCMSGPTQLPSGHFSDTSGSASTISGKWSDHPFMSGPLDSSFSISPSVTARQQARVSQLHSARSRRSDERSVLWFLAKTASKLRFGPPLPRYGPPLLQEPGDPKRVSFSGGDYHSPPNGNVEWAQGMAGEDRFHVAVSKDPDWVFVGIYDGFNGPDATDYLFANLYVAVHDELKGVLWNDIQVCDAARCSHHEPSSGNAEHPCFAQGNGEGAEATKRRRTGGPVPPGSSNTAAAMHRDVLRALARALKKTEDAFFAAAEERAGESPELGLVGSCVLVMLMKGTDVYVMNVGDSRAVLARRPEPDLKNVLGKASQDLKQFKAEIMRELQAHDMDGLQAVQLTPEHSMAVEEEVRRIQAQHLNDRNAIVNGRVKGKINVTRAFGVGYLKQPKWNSRLLAAFKINYVGTDPYISCTPALCHHRIGSQDKFLVLSSDGLYQFFTNKEVVDQVEAFTAKQPEGDPAQHLVGELVVRAARKAGMASHELLDIPRGARRRYHDDVSIIVISFEGRIWRSSV